MNFSFEGNFKPRRNINLGGVKKLDDKRSLLAKAQSERKAREQERLKQKGAQQIQVNFEPCCSFFFEGPCNLLY
jgi:ubiquitin-protein ligase E3 C